MESLIQYLAKSALPAEFIQLRQNLIAICPDALLAITQAIEQQINTEGVSLGNQNLAIELNKDSSTGKYYDNTGRNIFNVDVKSLKAIDFETQADQAEGPSYLDDLRGMLQVYGDRFYPSSFAYCVIPQSSESFTIVIIGQRLDEKNSFSGSWRAIYKFTNDHTVNVSVVVDIHYFEDGNVSLKFSDESKQSCPSYSASSVADFIKVFEDRTVVKIVKEFGVLNNNSFKAMRRLLPVTRSRVNWGKAIGNYKLGTDVLNV